MCNNEIKGPSFVANQLILHNLSSDVTPVNGESDVQKKERTELEDTPKSPVQEANDEHVASSPNR